MKKSIISTAILAAVLLPITVLAQSYRYNYALVTNVSPANLAEANIEYGPWNNVDSPYACSNWSPSTSTIGKGTSFVQTATDCKQDQERWAQDYENNRPLGDRYTVQQTITTSQDRDAVGILENWTAFDPTYTSWVDTNALYGCTSWIPDPAFYTETTNFPQTANDCHTDQERWRQDREQERHTEAVRNVGEPVVESQTLREQSASRSYAVVLEPWKSSGDPYDCSNWSPAAETEIIGQSFIQTATDCKQDQERSRTESYVDHKTGQTISVSSISERQTLTEQSHTRTATGTDNNFVSDNNNYFLSCVMTGMNKYSDVALWKGEVVLNKTVTEDCISDFTSYAGYTFTGSDGKSYTVGPKPPYGRWSIRQN